jgi:hypothetical protein
MSQKLLSSITIIIIIVTKRLIRAVGIVECVKRIVF